MNESKILLLKILVPYVSSYKRKATVASLSMLANSLLALPAPYLMKLVIDDALKNSNLSLLNLIIMVILIVQIAKFAFSFLASYLFGIFSREIITRIKKDFINKIIIQPLSFFDNAQTGYLLSRIGEIEGLNIFFSDSMVKMLIGIVEFFFSLVILIHLNWKLSIICLLILPAIFMGTRLYSRKIGRISLESMEKNAAVSNHIQDTISSVDIVKIFSAEERRAASVFGFLEELKRINIKQTVIYAFSSELLSLIAAIGGLIVLWISGWDILQGRFTIGSYIAFSGYLAKLYGPTQNIANIGLYLQPAFIALQRFSEMMKPEGENIDCGQKLRKLRGKIEFRNVSFSYDTKPTLKNISLTINPGEKVLVVGPNGSGKSTLVKLILGLYKPKEGEIRIDDLKIEEISLSSLRERMGVVSQNTILLNDTISGNILFSQPEASEANLRRAAELSGVAEFVSKLKDGYRTLVGEKGKRLSGGERQKIAIARAIIRDADIIIFDEATAHLDSGSKERIESLVKNRFKDNTCIIIAHEKWAMSFVGRIIKLEKGRTIER